MTDRILVNSQAIKDRVVQEEHVRAAKIDVIYNGIDLVPFSDEFDVTSLRSELGVPDADRVVGMVANLNRQVKRPDLFIEAAALTLKEVNQITFVMVGEGYLRPGLEQKVKDLGIEGNVIFTGSQENVIPYLKLFDIGVITSESEGFANAILEYMAAELPVVCFDSGGNRELIEDGLNGFIVSEISAKGIADMLVRLLFDELVCIQMRKNNNYKIGKYEWNNIMANMADYYIGFDSC